MRSDPICSHLKAANPLSRANVLVHYYELFLERYKGADAPQLFEAKTSLGQVAKELEKLGMDETLIVPPRKRLTLNLGKGVTMKLVLIPAGKFMMGSPKTEKDRSDNEGPQRRVTISKAFYMGVMEVTQEQYQSVVGGNPSKFKGPQNPADGVLWNRAMAFCTALSKKTGRAVRLPTEAEWEYACGAGTGTRFSFGNDNKDLAAHGWYGANSGGKTHPVGQKKPNAWGLYDMHGNVWEWCRDSYDVNAYANAKDVDPKNTTPSKNHVVRGASWHCSPEECRTASRMGGISDNRHVFGLRVVVEVGVITLDLGKGVTMKLRRIDAGKFMMGSPKTEIGRREDEGPQREVTISKPFYMGVTEVTQEQYQAITGKTPSRSKGPNNPVEMVSWNDATAFCGEWGQSAFSR